MTTARTTPKDLLLQAAILHVPFDGWSRATFDAAIADSGVERTVAVSVCPRGAVDLAAPSGVINAPEFLRRASVTVQDRCKPDAPLQFPLTPLRSAPDADFPR